MDNLNLSLMSKLSDIEHQIFETNEIETNVNEIDFKNNKDNLDFQKFYSNKKS